MVVNKRHNVQGPPLGPVHYVPKEKRGEVKMNEVCPQAVYNPKILYLG